MRDRQLGTVALYLDEQGYFHPLSEWLARIETKLDTLLDQIDTLRGQ